MHQSFISLRLERKRLTKEIAAALREGGVESTAGNFESIVTTALNRLRAAGEVLKFKDGWGLSEWYPANMRASGSAVKASSQEQEEKQEGEA